MTVIATDGHTMAGEGRVVYGHVIVTDEDVKVHRFPDGSLIGAAGSASTCERFLAWKRSGEPWNTDEDLDGLTALEVTPDGTVLLYTASHVPITITAPAAIGSGDDLALGVLDLGYSPEEAVRVACARSAYCGGKITVVSR